MKIFYINFKDIKPKSKQEHKKLQSAIGRFIVKFVAHNYYGVENTEIVVENKKPKFKFSNLNFNISHSENMVVCAFDEFPLGIDVEYMRERNFQGISDYLKIEYQDKKRFYQYWTQYEAQIKLQAELNQILSFEIIPDYMFSLFSSNSDCGIKTKLKIYELKSPTESINPIELMSLNPVNASSPNENALVAQERNIASVEFLTPLTLKTE